MIGNSQMWESDVPNLKKFVLSRTLLTALTAVWLLLVGTGFAMLAVYQNDAGDTSEREAAWEDSSLVQRDAARCQLLVFLHPRCACSLATLNELAQIQSTCQDRLAIQVVIYNPSGAGADWLQSPNVNFVMQIPHVEWTLDPDGNTARKFGVMTSGHAILFSPSGDLVFSGGITPSRAHEGDNLGRQAIERYVCLGEKIVEQSNVFGCPIFGDSFQNNVQPRKASDVVK